MVDKEHRDHASGINAAVVFIIAASTLIVGGYLFIASGTFHRATSVPNVTAPSTTGSGGGASK